MPERLTRKPKVVREEPTPVQYIHPKHGGWAYGKRVATEGNLVHILPVLRTRIFKIAAANTRPIEGAATPCPK